MRGILATRVALVLFLFTFCFVQPSHAVEYSNVPKSCEKLFRELGRSASKALKPQVDWTAVFAGMAEMGYPNHIATEKLEELDWSAGQALESIRQATNDTRWNWGGNFTRDDSRQLARDAGNGTYYSNEILHNLPFWFGLKGFDPAAFVNEWFKVKKESGQSLQEDEQKSLRKYARLWLSGGLAQRNAQLYFKVLDEVQDVSWAANQLPPKQRKKMMDGVRRQIERDFFKNLSGDTAQEDLAYSSMMPWKSLPTKVRDYLVDQWLELDRYKPITLNSIRLIANGYRDAGSCQMMTNGHVNSLALHNPKCNPDTDGMDEWKQSILIRVEGKLIGSLKLVGDHSMIALRNVFDASGRLVLALGGVYHIDRETYDNLNINSETPKNGRWRTVHLESLAVHPHSFLFNEGAWTDQNKSQLLRLAADSMTREELIELVENFPHNRFDGSIDGHEEMRAKAWLGLLKALDRVRRERE